MNNVKRRKISNKTARTHLTEEEYNRIKMLLNKDLGVTFVARAVRRGIATVSYINRSSSFQEYQALIQELTSRKKVAEQTEDVIVQPVPEVIEGLEHTQTQQEDEHVIMPSELDNNALLSVLVEKTDKTIELLERLVNAVEEWNKPTKQVIDEALHSNHQEQIVA